MANCYPHEFHAYRIKKKHKKIHIGFKPEYFTYCSKRFTSQDLEIQDINDIHDLNCILDDPRMCKNCKKDLQALIRLKIMGDTQCQTSSNS